VQERLGKNLGRDRESNLRMVRSGFSLSGNESTLQGTNWQKEGGIKNPRVSFFDGNPRVSEVPVVGSRGLVLLISQVVAPF
jgi:hypothetical protein